MARQSNRQITNYLLANNTRPGGSERGEHSPSDAPAFDSGVISAGGFKHTFEESGTYDYYCIPHKSVGMVGRIVVGNPGGPAEESPIPNGDVPDSDVIVEQGTIAYGSSTGGDRNSGGGMRGPGMGSGPGMMNGRNGGLPFVGGLLGMLGLVGGLLYWALGRGDAPPESDDSAMETLQRRYARGEIDEEEFEDRRAKLSREELQ